MQREKYTSPVTVATYKAADKKIQIKKVQKVGTKRIFFFPVTEEGKRLTSILWARKSSAISLGKKYLQSQ